MTTNTARRRVTVGMLPCRDSGFGIRGIRDSRFGRGFVRKLTIAIDGPSGAGKGTVARAIAAALGYRHVDSGAMYRAVGWKAIHDSVPLDNEPEVAALASSARLEVVDTVVTVDDYDVTRAIRTPEIDRA